MRKVSTTWSLQQTTQAEEPNPGETGQDEHQDSSAEDGEDQLKRDILDAALPFVHSYGWSQEAIAQGK